MKWFRMLKKERNHKKISTGISLQVLTIFYLIFLIGFQLQSPTTAYFSSTVTVQGTFAAKPDFEVEGNVSDERVETVDVQNDEKEKLESEKDEGKEELEDGKERLESEKDESKEQLEGEQNNSETEMDNVEEEVEDENENLETEKVEAEEEQDEEKVEQ